MATRKKRTTKKKPSRSGFFSMLLVLIALGAVIYWNRDKFLVLLDTSVSNSSTVIAQKKKNIDNKENQIRNFLLRIGKLEGFGEKNEITSL